MKLTINNFLGIHSADITIGRITVLIGEQASGKSVVARLIYFFTQYFADFDELSLSKGEHKSTYDKNKKEEFFSIFPPYSWERDSFEIFFALDEYEVRITSDKGSGTIKIKTSNSVGQYFRDLKRQYQKFLGQYDADSPVAPSRALREFRMMQAESGAVRFESPLFVPAARSFYATLRDEIFSILALDSKIDNIILQFGEFYEVAKRGFAPPFSGDLSRRAFKAGREMERRFFDGVVKGQLVRADGRDWIQMERGLIELSRASSGQQEATPLLLALSRYPSKGRTLIIEEPEAHLFPSAQTEILKFMVWKLHSSGGNFIFTTHSPYLLSSLNVSLARGASGREDGISSDDLSAYALYDGEAHSLIDEESGMISAAYIDSVSENLEEELIDALEK